MENNTATKLIRITKKAKEEPKVRFTFLKYLLNEAYLEECFHLLKTGKAAGVDGRTLESYSEVEMGEAIRKTIEHMKADQYRPQPVRQVKIPKENGKQRSLGIPTVMDKVVQLGCSRILEAIFEPTFLPVSFGYRPGMDAHACLKEINHMVMGKPVNYVLETDIEGFFDHVNHDWLIKCLEVRIGDPRFINLIVQFLKAGVMEGYQVKATTQGTPQGGVLSPILANIYLHYVLDLWFTKREQPVVTGYSQLVRYADDFVIGCQHQPDARRIRQDLKERLEHFGLRLSVEKTNLIEFGRFAEENRKKREGGKPQTFDFLGFTHYCDHTRDGRFAMKVRTSRKRFTRAVKSLESWLKQVRTYLPILELWPLLQMKLRGHYQYYGVSGNFESIKDFYQLSRRLTFKWLNRRSQKKSWTWQQFSTFVQKYQLPQPKLTYAFYNTW